MPLRRTSSGEDSREDGFSGVVLLSSAESATKAKKDGWFIISMKNNWKQILAF
jgi:hypothetical protein